MIRIDWQGKIGYGDICGPISYAHNLSDKTGHHVELAFHWAHPRGTKTYSDDPETLDERADYILKLMEPANVSMLHIYESDRIFDSDRPHTNYTYTFDLHNYWWSTLTHRRTSDRIVVCPPTENKTSFPPEKFWKDPFANEWNLIVKNLRGDVVSYRTPIDELVNKLLGCRLFVGYHGSCAWIARHLRVPMVLFSKNKVTNIVFPCELNYRGRALRDLNRLITSSQRLIDIFDDRLLHYKFSDEVLSRITYSEDIHRI